MFSCNITLQINQIDFMNTYIKYYVSTIVFVPMQSREIR